MPAGLDGNPNPVVSPEGTLLLDLVAGAVLGIDATRPVLVGVDGASGTGKSTFADELTRTLVGRGRSAVRASVDSFHRPRAERYRRGKDSPDGYYHDSHDLTALRQELLDPFARGDGSFRRAVFDEPSDQPLDEPPEPVPANGILVVDGLFLHRAELIGYWHLTVYLVANARREAMWQDYLERDLPADPDARHAEVERRVGQARRRRYVEGQALYEREAQPLRRAHFVIENDDFARPLVVARRGTG